MQHLIESMRFVNALPPVADAFSGTVYGASVKVSGNSKVLYLVQKGVGTTGTSTITVLASSDASRTATTAIPFLYRRIAANNTTVGAVTAATTAGFTTTAGSSDSYLIEIDTDDVASTGYSYVALKLVESVDSPVLGGIYAILADSRYASDTSDIIA